MTKMTCVELYDKVISGMISCRFQKKDGTGCKDCPYKDFSNGTGPNADNPCYSQLHIDHYAIKTVLEQKEAPDWNEWASQILIRRNNK